MRCATIRQATNCHGRERIDIRDRQLLHFLVQLLYQFRPIFKADLKYFSVVDLAYPDKVIVCVRKIITIGKILNQLSSLISLLEQVRLVFFGLTHTKMHCKKVTEKQGQIKDKLLISRIAGWIGTFKVQ